MTGDDFFTQMQFASNLSLKRKISLTHPGVASNFSAIGAILLTNHLRIAYNHPSMKLRPLSFLNLHEIGYNTK